jgi:putative transposase
MSGYDYSQEGAHFVTVCTQGKKPVGEVVDWVMRLYEAGRAVETVWKGLPDRFPMMVLDEFVVMPNHVHGKSLYTGIMIV